MNKKTLVVLVILIATGFSLWLFTFESQEKFENLVQTTLFKIFKFGNPVLGEKTHEHVDFAVYLEGKKIDFTLAKYQSTGTNPLDPNVHLHDGNGSVVHKHRFGVTLGYFFETLGMKFSNKCFVTDDGDKYCNGSYKKLKLYVNGKENKEFDSYEFNDLDKILISYGDEANLENELNSVSDDACLYSLKCPERGTPPTENCAGGLGEPC